MLKKNFLVLFFLLIVFSCKKATLLSEEKSLTFREPEKMERKGDMFKVKLSNGMDVIVEENHSAPVVAIQVWVKVGSGDEKEDEAGLAHFHEHMVFKGTEKYGLGEIARVVENHGGIINAFTSSDFTVYHIVFSKRFFELGLEILNELVWHPTFDPEELEREKEVVLEEIRREKINPRVLLYRHLFETAYQIHPYRHPTIGYEEGVAGFSRDDLISFHNKWYKPENMLLTIVGDIKAQDAISAVKRYFLEKKEEFSSASPRQIKEPPQESMRVKLVGGDLNQSYCYLSFHIPGFELKNPEELALFDILGVILGEGESSRLVKVVNREKKLADDVWAYSFTPRGPGLLLVGIESNPKKFISALEETLMQIYLLKDELVLDEELERAKRKLESEAIYSSQTVQSRARRIGSFMCLTNDPWFEERYRARLRSATKEEIQAIAKQYLVPECLTVAVLVPQSELKRVKEEKIRACAQDAFNRVLKGKVSSGLKEEEYLPPFRSLKEQSKHISEPVRFKLDNGIVLLVRENHYVPVVSIRAGFLGGVRVENEKNNGICNFVSRLLPEGTKKYSGIELHRRIESMAGMVSGFSGMNSFGLSMEVLSGYLEEAFELFAGMIKEPSFPEEEVERERLEILGELRTEKDLPRKLVLRRFQSALFHSHPYKFTTLGNEEVIARLKREDLEKFYLSWAGPSRLVISVSGDVNAKQMKELVERFFKDFSNSPTALPKLEPEPLFSEPRVNEECIKTAQTQMMLGYLSTTVKGADEPVVQVIGEILSGMGGRLFMEMREKKSLAYEVGATHFEGLEPGYFAIYIGTGREKEAQAKEGILKEISRLMEEDVSQQELERAKNSLIGNFEISLQSNTQIAGYMFFDELYGLGFRHYEEFPDRIKKVTSSQVKETANKYFSKGYALSVLKPCSKD